MIIRNLSQGYCFLHKSYMSHHHYVHIKYNITYVTTEYNLIDCTPCNGEELFKINSTSGVVTNTKKLVCIYYISLSSWYLIH